MKGKDSLLRRKNGDGDETQKENKEKREEFRKFEN
jgi:hypothetical protein